MRSLLPRRLRHALLIAVPAVIFSATIACAGNAADVADQNLLPVPTQETQSTLIHRLQVAKKDMEAFRLFTEHFRQANEKTELAQLGKPVDDFLKKHVDNLLVQASENWTLETARLSAEIMLLKAHLLLNVGHGDAVSEIIADLKKRYGAHQKISVEISGKATTLDEAIKLLEEDLAAAPKNESTKG